MCEVQRRPRGVVPALTTLQCTMGAPSVLEFAREELALLRGVPASAISDDALVAHFRAAIEPGGHYHDYLAAAQLAVCVGTTLFVHGAITADNAGFVPAPTPRYGANQWTAPIAPHV